MSVVFKLEILYPFLIFKEIGFISSLALAAVVVILNSLTENDYQTKTSTKRWITLLRNTAIMVGVVGLVSMSLAVIPNKDSHPQIWAILAGKLFLAFLALVIIGRAMGLFFDSVLLKHQR